MNEPIEDLKTAIVWGGTFAILAGILFIVSLFKTYDSYGECIASELLKHDTYNEVRRYCSKFDYTRK